MTTGISRRQACLAAAGGALWSASRAAMAQQGYPSRPPHLIVPFTPGGSSDVLGRAIGQELGRAWNQAVVIENVPGAGGSVGAEKVARAPADGYTLLMGHIGTLAVNPSLYPKLGYDPLRSFAPVAWVARVPNLLVVHASVPARTLAELIALAKARPGQLAYGSGGNGSAAHMTMEYLKLQTGTSFLHIPYKGTAPSVNDLLAGQVQVLFTGAPALLPHIKAGKMRALAVSSPRRIALLPEVPTVAESLPGFEFYSWYGFWAPARTPPEIVKRLNAEVNKALASELRERFTQQGLVFTPGSVEDFVRFQAADMAKSQKIITEGQIRVE